MRSKKAQDIVTCLETIFVTHHLPFNARNDKRI